MSTIICFLRGVNVGGHAKLKMAQLKELCESCGLTNVHTVLQSGNIVFTSKRASFPALAHTIADAITEACGFTPDVILRTPAELHTIIDRNPFVAAAKDDPSHLLVMLLASPIVTTAAPKLAALAAPAEQFVIGTREVYIYYGNTMARTKLAGAVLEKALGARGTARNWNTLRKLLGIADTIAN